MHRGNPFAPSFNDFDILIRANGTVVAVCAIGVRQSSAIAAVIVRAPWCRGNGKSAAIKYLPNSLLEYQRIYSLLTLGNVFLDFPRERGEPNETENRQKRWVKAERTKYQRGISWYISDGAREK